MMTQPWSELASPGWYPQAFSYSDWMIASGAVISPSSELSVATCTPWPVIAHTQSPRTSLPIIPQSLTPLLKSHAIGGGGSAPAYLANASVLGSTLGGSLPSLTLAISSIVLSPLVW